MCLKDFQIIIWYLGTFSVLCLCVIQELAWIDTFVSKLENFQMVPS